MGPRASTSGPQVSARHGRKVIQENSYRRRYSIPASLPLLDERVYCGHYPITKDLFRPGGKIRNFARSGSCGLRHNACNDLVSLPQFDRLTGAKPSFEPPGIAELTHIDGRRCHTPNHEAICITLSKRNSAQYRLCSRSWITRSAPGRIAKNLPSAGGEIGPFGRFRGCTLRHDACDNLVRVAEFDCLARARPDFEAPRVPKLAHVHGGS